MVSLQSTLDLKPQVYTVVGNLKFKRFKLLENQRSATFIEYHLHCITNLSITIIYSI